MYNSQEENTNPCTLDITAKKRSIVHVGFPTGCWWQEDNNNKHNRPHHKTLNFFPKKRLISRNIAMKK